MFNLIKNPELKENAADLVDNTKTRAKEIKNEIADDVEEISAEVKKSATQLGKKVKAKSVETKQEAESFLSNIKRNLDADKISDKSSEIAEQLVVFTDSIKEELIDAFKASIAGTEKVVRTRTLLSLSIAVGAGLALGYVLAKSGSTEEA
jgi:ElaB/YqjD/DUF883 family membrane-anchored ribosome-binding protein